MALSVWNGSSWTTAAGVKVWNGSAWVNAQAGKVWNGSAWVDFLVNITISNDSVSVDTVYESDFDYNIANYGIKSNGKIYAIGNSSTSGLFYGTTHDTNWVTPTTAASGYEVRATLVTGNTPIGPALNTWHACTSDRIWYLDLTGFGQYSCTLTIDIRDTATSTIRDTATVTLFVKIGV